MPDALSDLVPPPAAECPDLAVLAAGGRVRSVLLYPDPALRQVCAPVGCLDWQTLSQLAADLLATMYDAGGRGLAAPQIGESWRIFVMDHGWKAGAPHPRVVLDPEIMALGSATEIMQEACLSIPDQPVAMRRPVDILMRCFDMTGELLTLTLSGIEARIAQHEADHLDGRLILDAMAAPDA